MIAPAMRLPLGTLLLLCAASALPEDVNGRCPGGLWSDVAQDCMPLGPPPDTQFLEMLAANGNWEWQDEGQRRPGETGRDGVHFGGDDDEAEEWERAGDWSFGKDPYFEEGSESPYGEGRVEDVVDAPSTSGSGRVEEEGETSPLSKERVSVAAPPSPAKPRVATAEDDAPAEAEAVAEAVAEVAPAVPVKAWECSERIDGNLRAPRWQAGAEGLNAYAIREVPRPWWLLLHQFRVVSGIPLRVTPEFMAALGAARISGLDIGAENPDTAAPNTICDWMGRLLEYVDGHGSETGRWLNLDAAGLPPDEERLLYPIMAPQGSLRQSFDRIAADYEHSVGLWRFGNKDLGEDGARFDFVVRRSALHLSPPDITGMLNDLGRLYRMKIRINPLDRTLDVRPAPGTAMTPVRSAGR